MLQKMPMTLEMKGLGPWIAHVTLVASPWGERVKSTTLWASKGSMKSSLIDTLEGGDASVISMRPLPISLLPSHSYTAPLPLGAPLKVFFIAGSFFSKGDQEPQLCRSLISAKTLSGDA
jgi:hypothetical protein